MNLLNRYLQAVARLLPKARRDDIIAELRANIVSQMEDREAGLGRSLTEDEQAEILRHHGNPTLVAGRYREGNLGLAFGVQLIGPELFPFYRNILLLNMGITLLILFPVSLIGRAVFPSIFFPLVMQVTIITLIFSLLNRYKVFDKWDPRKLPALRAAAEEGPEPGTDLEYQVNVPFLTAIRGGVMRLNISRLIRPHCAACADNVFIAVTATASQSVEHERTNQAFLDW